MKRALLVLVAACWSSPKAPGTAGIPGLVWMTERPPYRVSGAIIGLAVDGNTALVASLEGRLARMDLATGRVLREVSIKLDAQKLVRLDANRWLAVGMHDEQFAAATIDNATLAATPLSLAEREEEPYHTVDAVMLPDGTVAIAGPGLPLAAWDPHNWKIKRTFAATHDWHRLHLDGGQLLATRDANTYGFDLADGEVTEYGLVSDVAAGRIVKRTFEKDGTFVPQVLEGGRVLVRPRGDNVDAILDASHFYAVGQGLLRVFDLPSGQLALQVDLGWHSRGYSRLVVDGKRIVLAMGAAVRVIDRETGAITPAGPPPFEIPRQLRVAPDGTVAAIDGAAWRLRDGKVVATSDPRERDDIELPPGDVEHYGSYGGSDPVVVTVRAIGGAIATHHWRSKPHVLGGWLGTSGRVALDANDIPAGILVSHGSELEKVGAFAIETQVPDIDVDAGGALVSMHGMVWRMRLVDGSHDNAPMLVPGCAEYPRAVLERGGDRALTANGHEIFVWTRGREKPVASIAVDDDADNAKFIHGGEIMFDFGDTLALWNPTNGDLRTLRLGTLIDAEASPDGKYVAIAFSDGRIALAELAALRRAMKVESSVPAQPPSECPGPDPFTLPTEDAQDNDD